MRRKCQLSVKSCVIYQLSGCYYLTEDLKPLLEQFPPQFFEGMYTGYTVSRLKNYHIVRTFRE